MTDNLNEIHAAVTGITVATLPIIGWLMKRFIKKVDDTAEALSRHEKEDIGKYATNDQLARVHDRIDESINVAATNFKELRDNIGDIKNLLISGKKP